MDPVCLERARICNVLYVSSVCVPNSEAKHMAVRVMSLRQLRLCAEINYDGGKQSAAPPARQTLSDLEPASDRTLLLPAGRLFGATAGTIRHLIVNGVNTAYRWRWNSQKCLWAPQNQTEPDHLGSWNVIPNSANRAVWVIAGGRRVMSGRSNRLGGCWLETGGGHIDPNTEYFNTNVGPNIKKINSNVGSKYQ